MVGFVVLSFNHPELTGRCLRSILDKGILPSSVFLVHNGSRGSVVETLSKAHPAINHVVLPRNLGFSGGANEGLRASFENSDLALFLSNDTAWKSGDLAALKRLEDFSSAHGILGAPRVEVRTTGRVHSLGAQVDLRTGELRHFDNEGSWFESLENIHEAFKKPYIPGSAFIISKKAWQKTGGFNDKLGTYWEDVELSLRAHALGVELLLIPELVFTHGIAKTTSKDPKYSVYYFHRNRRRVIARHLNGLSKISFYLGECKESVRRLSRYAFKADRRRFFLFLASHLPEKLDFLSNIRSSALR